MYRLYEYVVAVFGRYRHVIGTFSAAAENFALNRPPRARRTATSFAGVAGLSPTHVALRPHLV
jgi:hypothetical protein